VIRGKPVLFLVVASAALAMTVYGVIQLG